MRKSIKKVFLAVLISIVCNNSYSQTMPLDPAVRTGKLGNGFTYYIRHNEEPKSRVVMYLVNKVGSVLEDEDQRGLAHFMEHMSFNGTKHFPKNELVDYLQKSGIRFGADLNAYTSFDETVYQLPIPSDKPELLKGAYLIMRDWAQEATLHPEEINKERGVVLEEKRLGKGAGERMQHQYWPVILNNSRYAVRIPIGIDTVLNNFKPKAIKRFYHDWYRPDLQALIVVGDVDVDKTEQTIRQLFSTLKNPVKERLRTKYTVPLTGENQFIVVTDKEMTTTAAEVMIKHQAHELRTLEDYHEIIIQSLFDQMLSARYAELGRKPDAPFLQGNASIAGFIGGLDNFEVTVNAKPGELEKGFKAVWREVVRLKKFGFTETELERAKTTYLNQMESMFNEKDKFNSERLAKEYQEYFLKGTAAPGISEEYRVTKTDLPKITLNDVNALAKQYITVSNRDILILAPDKDKNSLPDETTVINWLKMVEAENLESYDDLNSTMPLLKNEPISGHIVNVTQDKLQNTILELNNGIKVILKPTNFKNDEILFSSFAPGGTSLYSDLDFQSANEAASIIAACGLGNYDPDLLQKYLEGKQFEIGPYIGERFQGISGASNLKDLEAAMKMIYAVYTEPRKDTAIFRGIIEKSIANLANRANDPNSVFSDTISAILSNNNIRRTGPSVEKLRQVNLDKAYAIYKDRFADASNFTFIFVGSFNIDSIKPLLEKYLGALPATYSHEKAKDLNIHIPEGKIEKNVLKGSEPQSKVLLIYSGKFEYSPENTVKLDALKEVLQIRLIQRLREEERGVYSPSVFENASKYPQSRYTFGIQFGCAPKNVDKLIASTLDEIKKIKTDGPTLENIHKWCAEEKTSFEPQLKTNGFWLSYILGQLQNQEDLNQVNYYKTLLDKVTPEELKDLATKYLSGSNFIRLVQLPEIGSNSN